MECLWRLRFRFPNLTTIKQKIIFHSLNFFHLQRQWPWLLSDISALNRKMITPINISVQSIRHFSSKITFFSEDFMKIQIESRAYLEHIFGKWNSFQSWIRCEDLLCFLGSYLSLRKAHSDTFLEFAITPLLYCVQFGFLKVLGRTS